MRNGRLLRMSLELLLGAGACLAFAVLMPLSFWHSLGDGGGRLLVLAIGALITSVTIQRNHPVSVEATYASSLESAG